MTQELTVVVTRYGESFEIVKQCLDSLALQSGCRCLVLFLDQNDSPQTRSYVQKLGSENVSFVYERIPAKSLSFARNTGIKKSNTDLVAFCDADTILPSGWASEIVSVFKEYQPAIVGTKILPKWQKKTQWYHHSRFIQEFYSLLDVSSYVCEIPKVIGASFAVDKTKLNDLLFEEKLGRKGGVLLGGEETDLCQKVRENGQKIFYTPRTFAYHQVAHERMKLDFLLRRAYFGGISRALRQGKPEPFNKSYRLLDRFSLLLILPSYLLGYLKGKTLHV